MKKRLKYLAIGAVIIFAAVAYYGYQGIGWSPTVHAHSSQAAEAKAQIQSWVPVGTTAPDARRVMEQHGFTCALITNGTFETFHGVDYLYCDRSEGSVIKQRWQAALILTEGKVSAVDLTTGLVGP